MQQIAAPILILLHVRPDMLRPLLSDAFQRFASLAIKRTQHDATWQSQQPVWPWH